MKKDMCYFTSPVSYATLVDINDKQQGANWYSSYMFARTNSMFEYDGLPETIPKHILEYYLQFYGFTIITWVKQAEIGNPEYKEGFYCFSEGVGLGGPPDNYYRPTKAIISNPSMTLTIERTINKDCALIKNDCLLLGLRNINSRYATQLVENDITFRVYDINARIMAILSSPDTNVSEALKRYLKDIEKGELGALTDSIATDGIKSQPYSNNTNSIKDLIEYHQYIKANWLNELGLKSNYNMKRESLGAEETSVNEGALIPFVDNMLETRQEGYELLSKIYADSHPINIKCDLASAWEDLQAEIEDDVNNEDTPKEEESNNEQQATI